MVNWKPESHLKRMQTVLKKQGVAVQNLNYEQIQNLYSEFCSKKAKSPETYEKWLKSNLAREETFSERSTRGLISLGRRKNNPNLELTDEEAIKLGSLKDADFGQRIKGGLLRIHGTQENISANFRSRKQKQIANFYDLNPDDVTRDIRIRYLNEIGFCGPKRDVFHWKKVQAEKFAQKELLNEDVEKTYAEYLSNRFSRNVLENFHNGYTRTKKGWYEFVSHDKKLFYRSSWEEAFFIKLDELFAQGKINLIDIAPRIQYTLADKKRFYYPDGLFQTASNVTYIYEIKPKKKIALVENQAKFSAARAIYHDKFIVISEDELKQDIEYV